MPTSRASLLNFARSRLRSTPRGWVAAALSLAVLGLAALHWWHPGTIIAQDDLAPQLDPSIWFTKSLAAWSDGNNYFGQIDGSFSFAPFMALWWLLDSVAGASLGEVLLFGLVLCAAWFGAFSFARRIGVTVAAATAAAWLYAVNPLTQLIFGSFDSTQAAFVALLPWLGFFVATAARRPQRRRFARASLGVLALVAVPVLGITPPLVFEFTLAAAAVAFFCAFFASDRREFAKWTAGTALVMIAVSLWWAVPDILSFAGAVIPHATSMTGTAWMHARSSLLNNERFLYAWVWSYPEYVPDAAAYDANLFTYAAGFTAFAGGLAGLIVLRGQRLSAARFAMACTLVVLFLSKGAHPPLIGLTALLWKIPGVFFFDDPLGGSVLALFLLSIVCAATFDGLFERYSARKHVAYVRAAAAAGVVAAAALSGTLLLSGASFHGPVDAPDGFDAPSVYVRVPAYWRAAATYLNEDPRSGGVLLLPPTLSVGYDVSYRWGYYGVDGLAQNSIARPLLSLDRGLLEGLGYIKHRESQAQADSIQALLDARSPIVANALRGIGIRFVLFRGDVFDPQHVWLTDADVARILGRVPRRFGALSIYDLGVPAPRLFLAHPSRARIARFVVDHSQRTLVSEPLRRVPATGLALSARASDDPSVVVSSPVPVGTKALLVALRGTRYRCPLYVPTGEATELDESIVPCLRAHRIEPDLDMLSEIRVRGIEFADPQSLADAPGTIVLSIRSAPRIAALATQGFSSAGARSATDLCVRTRADCTAGAVLAHVPASFSGLAILSQLYNASWLAVELGGGVHVPRHVRVDGWRNGWMLSQGGTLVVLNAVVAFQVLALLVAIGVVIWNALRAGS